ncbi:hypothetical protein BDV93DRAFT_545977 [Ceratobasidium sp. AG-I]|nr:hypothetical protein BDV93DRAFT_545977 [Ceratobasidium sp. AG-I]
MPQLTRELIMKQRTANGLPYPTPPSSIRSESPYRSPSPQPSRVTEWSSPGASGSLTQSDTLRRPARRTILETRRCWIPTLDEVSRADPVQRMLLFQRLADEERQDEQRASKSRAAGRHPNSRKPERRAASRRAWASPRRREPMPAPATEPSLSSIGIGALALQLVRPCPSYLSRHPAMSSSRWPVPVPETERTSFFDSSGLDEKSFGLQWSLNVPESPKSEAWAIEEPGPSEEVIAKWVEEDMETERRLKEEQEWRFQFVV